MNIQKPSWFLHFTEFIRASIELVRGVFYLNFATRTENIGKQQVILVIPGLISTDLSTTLLRKFLIKKGYLTFGWEMGRNLGRAENLPILIDKVKNLQSQHQQKIVLIGWSMGGIFAREIAKACPDSIKQVMTLGSPFGRIDAPNHAKWVFGLLNREEEIDQKMVAQMHLPAPVPTLAFYSKMDGVIPWQACCERVETEIHRNIEVQSSHFGMGVNPNVMKAVFTWLNTA